MTTWMPRWPSRSPAGAAVIKIALNADAGPVWPDDRSPRSSAPPTRRAGRSSPTSRGPAQSARAAAAGVDAFAHTPFTERLDDALIAAPRRDHDLDQHPPDPHRARSRDGHRQPARFHAAGGRILYGTDMGNGPSSGGVERDELKMLVSFGIADDALIEALTGGGLLPRWGATVSRVDGEPASAAGLVAWLSGASVVRS